MTFSPFGLLPSCFLPFSLDHLPLLYACTLFFLSFDVRNKVLQRGQFHVSASCPISLPSPIDSWPLLCACALLTFAKILQFLANWAPASDMLVAFTLPFAGGLCLILASSLFPFCSAGFLGAAVCLQLLNGSVCFQRILSISI